MRVLFIASLIAAAFAQGRQPSIPESFTASADFRVNFTENNQAITLQGRGEFNINQALKAFLQDDRVFDQNRQEHTVYRLERFDLGKEYSITGMNRDSCNVTVLSGSTPTPFEWVSMSRFLEARMVRGVTIDVWGVTQDNILREVGVAAVAPNRPIFFALHDMTTNSRREYFFDTFIAMAPPARVFDVPRQCGNVFAASGRALLAEQGISAGCYACETFGCDDCDHTACPGYC